MSITFYDLAGAEDERRFSPHCWRAALSLAHKGLDAEAKPWRFTEKEAIAFSGQGATPVLVDGETTIVDSWAIAEHLDQTYPDRPMLFEGPQARAIARFVKFWAETTLHPAVLKTILMDLFERLHEKDKAYFRESREKRFGKPLEQVALPEADGVAGVRAAFAPLRATLADQSFLSGEAPAFADYLAFAPMMWARAVSPIALLETDDPVHAWRERMLDAHGGFCRKAMPA